MQDAITRTGPQSKKTAAEQALRPTSSHATAEHLALEVLHEIRNPLEALGNLTYLAYEEADDPQQVRKYMRLAGEQMAMLNHIASQTLGYARSFPSPKAINLASLMKSAIRIHQQTIDKRKIHLLKDFPEGLVMELYSGELLQVFSNLIANALDALPVEGILRLRFRERQNEVHFLIADSGQGIPAEALRKSLNRFSRPRRRKGRGSVCHSQRGSWNVTGAGSGYEAVCAPARVGPPSEFLYPFDLRERRKAALLRHRSKR